MLAYLLTGVTYAFAASAQPGPFQAYLISSTLANGWRRTLPAVLAPVLSDVPVICLVLLVLTRVPPVLADLLRLAGGAFLLWLSIGALRTFRHYRATRGRAPVPAGRRVLNAVLVNLLNPNPYLAWSLVLGPALIGAWRLAPAYGVALLVSFYATMVVTTGALVMAFAGAGSHGPRVGRASVGVSAVALAGFGVYQLWSGAASLLR